MRGRIWMWVLLSAAAVMVLVGGGLLMTSPAPNGWFACVGGMGGMQCVTPLRPERVGGAVLAIVGLLLVAGVGGWVLGLRAGRRDQPEDARR
ncbi:hypothetical protein [Leifsonia sp. SIMBA_070]|uniref:hypothetical protein n=1 Tax=Leifsonia sp. SIMBA_070 TaxID=3085810 RepID=UPI003979A9FD